ncbi:MAG: 4-hydroxy-tetrahydrodipicolinate synthase [Desulfofustis sp.]|nr:4-hydroxy-tetrahydrodipicolinate synthase [Desulfofustis sp.]
MFSGVFTAIVTPFHDGGLDEESLRNLIDFQIENGVSGIVPCGTTGESPTLSHSEYLRTIKITVDAVRKRVPVVAGAGANATSKAVALSREAMQLGVDATLQVAPYYNKPTQEGLYQHFKAIAEVGMPVMVYNVPGRTGVNIVPETMARLSKLPEIAALKDASGDLSQAFQTMNLCGETVDLLSGDDALTLPILHMGGKGVVSVVSNVLPGEMSELFRCWDTGDRIQAAAIYNRLLPIMHALFIEPNPIPVKTALRKKTLIKSAELRLPLTAMSDVRQAELFEVMKEYEA